MATDPAKHVVPAGSDGARRQTLLDLIASAHDIVPVASATERNTVAAAMIAAGRNPATAPIVVDRTDTNVWERTTDGTTWKVYAQAVDDTGWLTMTLDSGATVSNGYTPKYRRLNGVVYLEGQSTQGGSTIWSVPAGFRRNAGSNAPRYSAMSGNSGSTPVVLVYSGATHQIFTTGGATVNLDGISWIAEL